MKARSENFQQMTERMARATENIRAIEPVLLGQNWPPDTEYSHEPMGDSMYLVWIYPFPGDERECLSCCTRITGKMEAKFREDPGEFYYHGEKKIGNCLVWINLENAKALRPQCRVEAYQATVTKYKSVCDDAAQVPA